MFFLFHRKIYCNVSLYQYFIHPYLLLGITQRLLQGVQHKASWVQSNSTSFQPFHLAFQGRILLLTTDHLPVCQWQSCGFVAAACLKTTEEEEVIQGVTTSPAADWKSLTVQVGQFFHSLKKKKTRNCEMKDVSIVSATVPLQSERLWRRWTGTPARWFATGRWRRPGVAPTESLELQLSRSTGRKEPAKHILFPPIVLQSTLLLAGEHSGR